MSQGNALRRRRHWKERFDAAAPFLFTRGTSLSGKRYGIGEAVPPELSVRSLKKFWIAGRIVRADFVPPNVTTGLPPVLSQHEQLVAATAELDPNDLSLYTGKGLPRVESLQAMVDFDVTVAARNQAWRAFKGAEG